MLTFDWNVNKAALSYARFRVVRVCVCVIRLTPTTGVWGVSIFYLQSYHRYVIVKCVVPVSLSANYNRIYPSELFGELYSKECPLTKLYSTNIIYKYLGGKNYPSIVIRICFPFRYIE